MEKRRKIEVCVKEPNNNESQHENCTQLDFMIKYKPQDYLKSSYGDYNITKHHNFIYCEQVYDILNWIFYTHDLKILHDRVLAINGAEPGVLTQMFCDTTRHFYKLSERETYDKQMETKLLDNRSMIYARHSKSGFAFDEIKHLNLIYRRYGTKQSDQRNRINGLFANAHTIDELKCEFQLLSDTSDEYNIIHRYVTNTREKFFVKHIFKIERQTEKLSFKPFESCKRMLLFHGTPIYNCYGILLNGLKVSDYEKRPGIFFADMPEKSFSFSHHFNYSKANFYDFVVLFVADVAVGKLTPYHNCNGSELPSGYRSIQSAGVYSRNMNDVTTIDNAIVPYGKPDVIENAHYYEFAEYFVAHAEQLKLKYLIVFRKL